MIVRTLRDGHDLIVDADDDLGRVSARTPITVSCSCGELLTHSILSQYKRALDMAEQNHSVLDRKLAREAAQ